MNDSVCDSRTLADGSRLELISWTSDLASPGKTMHQVMLRRPGNKIFFPPDYEHYTGAQIRDLYRTIESGDQLERIALEHK